MLDPLTTLGLVSNIVQLVDFGLNVLEKGHELAHTGTTAERQHLRCLAEDTRAVCDELHSSRPRKYGQQDVEIANLEFQSVQDKERFVLAVDLQTPVNGHGVAKIKGETEAKSYSIADAQSFLSESANKSIGRSKRSAMRDPQIDPVFTTVASGETLQRVPDGRGFLRAMKPGRRGRSAVRAAKSQSPGVAVDTIASLPAFETENLVDLAQLQTNEAKGSATSPEADADTLNALMSLGNETQIVATRLSEMLSQLDLNTDTTGKRKRKRGTAGHIAQSILKGLWTSKHVERTRKELVDLQQQMMFRSSLMQTTSCSALLKSLGEITQHIDRQQTDRIAAMDTIMPDIHASLARTMPASPAAATFTADMDRLAEDVVKVEACRRVLKTLMFEKIHSREEAIPEAHATTFAWIFDERTTTFKDWMSSSNGVFWITGKPGSGKSTLMKYIVQHSHTTELLRAWAGHKELVVAHHYFWNAGTSMQKSQLGLLHTLLFHIIQQCPDTAYKLLPTRMNTDYFGETVPWTRDELCQTIRLFGKSNTGGARLCFFIDGLDEYVGEHSDLVELITTLAGNPCVKICVSSRPWNVFTRAYHGRTDGQLQVQDLTLFDITTFISDSMNADQRFRDLYAHDEVSCVRLIDSITSKAQGVFLWVYLVVRSLLRGFTNNDDLKILRRRLDTYPDTLDGYFWRMFNRIESVYRVESSRLLLAAISAERTMGFWTPRCIELEMEDSDYALAVSVPPTAHDAELVYGCDCSSARTLSGRNRPAPTSSRSDYVEDAGEINHNCYWHTSEDKGSRSKNRQSLNTYLDARCADLLEIVADGISFVHRTARDWLAHGDLLSIVDAKRQSRPGTFSIKEQNLAAELVRARGFMKGANLSKYAELIADLERREELWEGFYNM